MNNMKRSVVLLVSTMLLLLAIASAVSAQMGGKPTPTLYGERGMMRADDFGQMDSRFIGFTENTLTQACNAFGVSIDDAISDLGLPADIDRGMTIGDIELQYGVKSDDIANYMAMHMRGTTTSFNARNMAEMRQQAMQGIRAQRMVHGLKFITKNNTSYGHYVTYAFDKSGKIKDFTISGDAIFDSVKVSDFDYNYEKVQGAVARYVGNSSLFRLHDNPTAIMQIKALNDTTVVFDLADGINVSDISDVNRTIVKITMNNSEGYLTVLGDGTAGVDVFVNGNETVTVNLVNNSQVMFRATPMPPEYRQTQYQYSERTAYMHQRINQGIAFGKVGAELTIRECGNSSCLSNYTPVNLQVRAAARNRVVLRVESEIEEGQVIIINLDNETIDLTRPERIRLRYDGVALERADNIDELFAGGNRALCYLLQENDTVSMAVYIPEFSEHEIIIDVEEEPEPVEEQPEEEVPIEEEAAPTPAFGAALALSTFAAAYIWRRT